jgi:hypothetical protein
MFDRLFSHLLKEYGSPDAFKQISYPKDYCIFPLPKRFYERQGMLRPCQFYPHYDTDFSIYVMYETVTRITNVFLSLEDEKITVEIETHRFD